MHERSGEVGQPARVVEVEVGGSDVADVGGVEPRALIRSIAVSAGSARGRKARLNGAPSRRLG